MSSSLPDDEKPPPLVDADFLKVIGASNRSIGDKIRNLMRLYPELLKLGWSPADIEMALEMGYYLESHVTYKGRWSRKYGCGPGLLHSWIRHYYDVARVEKIGISLDEYISVWRSLAHNKPLTAKMHTLELMKLYMIARRHGLKDPEIRYSLFYRLDHFESYLLLRRRFSTAAVEQLANATWSEPWGLNAKYVIEAQQRGASFEQILESVKSNTTHELALELRKVHRALAQ